MEFTTTTIIFLICGILVGFVIAKIFEKSNATKIIKDANSEASIILKSANQEGESLKKDKMLQAKERFIELKSEHEKVIYSREDKMKSLERMVNEKDAKASKLLKTQSDINLDLESKSNDFDKKLASLDKKKSELDKNRINQIKQLEVISGLSEEDAKEQLLGSLKEEAKTDAMKFIQDRMEEAKMTVEQDAKKIIINTIQRIGTEESIDNCVSVFNIESDDVKGRIIGREGRNIRALEAATGVEIIVDDTPEAIILSCFDSIRREIARLSLHKLVTDGRIHPARIEEIVKKTEKQIDQEIIEIGKRPPTLDKSKWLLAPSDFDFSMPIGLGLQHEKL